MRLSIRLKFLLVMSGLLIACLGVYLFMAVRVFKSDKTQLVFDLNRSQVSNLAGEVETNLKGVSEKLKLFAQMPPHMQEKMIGDWLADDSDIVNLSIFKNGAELPLQSHSQNRFLETYGLDKNSFSQQLRHTPIPFQSILSEGEDLWNASAPGMPPLIGYGRLVLLQDEHGVPVDQWTVVCYIKLDRFLKSVSIVSLSEVLITNKRGEVLVQKNAGGLASKPDLRRDPFFQKALESKTRLSVMSTEQSLAAFAKAFNGQVIVIAKAPEREVFRVVRELGTRTLLFGSIVLTLVILAAFWLSRSLTHNIALLASRMENVSKGDLSTEIFLRGRDETLTLATTFNKMIRDLNQSRTELEIINRELDQKVKERTAQLEEQNRKVQEAQEALLRTTRLASVGEIAGRTAHEVLNPLTSLLTRAGLMQQRVDKEYKNHLALLAEISAAWKKDFADGGFDSLLAAWKTPSQVEPGKNLFEEDLQNLIAVKTELDQQVQHIHDDTHFIREEGNRIGKIINSMRRLGHVNSDVRTHSLHTVLTDCCHIMADLFEQKGFLIEKSFQAPQDLSRFDRDEFIQAVTNLMRNSLQALEDVRHELPPGQKPRIRLRTSIDNNSILIDIEDNGIGVSGEYQSRLFESSFTTKTPEKGTGLGLGISRRFIRNYGGDIEFVSSTPLKQTVFRIRMPLHAKPERQGAAA